MYPDTIHQQIDQYLKMLKAEHQNAMPYQICKELAACTKELIERDDTISIKKYLRSLSGMYIRTKNNMLKTAIENEFVYSLGNGIMCCTKRQKMMRLMPSLFRNIMIRQMTTSGI